MPLLMLGDVGLSWGGGGGEREEGRGGAGAGSEGDGEGVGCWVGGAPFVSVGPPLEDGPSPQFHHMTLQLLTDHLHGLVLGLRRLREGPGERQESFQLLFDKISLPIDRIRIRIFSKIGE